MRGLAGCVLLLATTAAFAQNERPRDIYHGAAGSYRKMEIRPGVILGIRYDPHGTASHMDIFAAEAPKPPYGRRNPIPMETIEGILDEILPQRTYGARKPEMMSCWGYPCHQFLQAEGVVIEIEQRPLRPPYQVDDVAIDFGLTLFKPLPLDPPSLPKVTAFNERR